STVRLAACGSLLVLSACTPQALPTPTAVLMPPTLTVTVTVPPPTDTPQPPMATRVPPTPAPTDIPPALVSEMDALLRKLAEQALFTGSVLIARQGHVLLSQGYGLADRKQKIPNT